MPEYRDKQFVSDWLRPQSGEYRNAPFIYPRRRVRTFDERETLGPGPTSFVEGRYATTLDRGFIKNLITKDMTKQFASPKRQRLNFQFNPNDIEQAVQMRSDVYLPILQDPSQYAQPMSAVATFGFQLLFDRTMEVGRGKGRGGTTDLMGDVDPAEAVYQIGVLSDLQVLYSIIGQGFSNDFIGQQLETIKQQARVEANEEFSSDDAGYAQALADIESASVSTFQGSANLGNNAFLIPMPVRIVFSELFMVDGFVTGTTVRFTKFNTNMVPIQASVGISMNAMYIGFAKQETFLTVQLDNIEENIRRDRIEKQEDDREVLNAVKQSARRFVFACDDSGEWLAGLGKDDELLPIANYAVEVAPAELKVGFKDAKTQGDNDKVLQLFQSGKSFSVSYEYFLDVYGPYDTLNVSAREASAKRSTQPKVGIFSALNVTATDEKSWKHIRSNSIRREDGPGANDNVSNNPLSGSPGDYYTKYFVVNLKAKVRAGGQTIELNEWKALRGDQKFYLEKDLTWPSFDQPYFIPQGSSTSTATAANTGTVSVIRRDSVNESGRLIGGV